MQRNLFTEDHEAFRALARDFHTRFYHVTPSEAQLDAILQG